MTEQTLSGLTWGQVVQSLLRCMDHSPRGEGSREQAERMAKELFDKAFVNQQIKEAK